MALTLMYITNNPDVAAVAQSCGVDRIWIDLETLGKEERQGKIDSVKSHHTIQDIKRLRPIISESELLVRINPINSASKQEIEDVIDAGADMIMLPMWKTVEDVQKFIEFVNRRVKTTLLLETKEAVQCLDEVLELGGFDEIHIGLNDLHLSYGLNFMFELLSNGTVEMLCNKIRQYNLPYGFGGIARIGEGILPAEKIIMEHYRLGSTRAILSRSFCNMDKYDLETCKVIFPENMSKLREYEKKLQDVSCTDYIRNKQYIKCRVAEIVQQIMEKRS